jgi:hypothetical protein
MQVKLRCFGFGKPSPEQFHPHNGAGRFTAGFCCFIQPVQFILGQPEYKPL